MDCLCLPKLHLILSIFESLGMCSPPRSLAKNNSFTRSSSNNRIYFLAFVELLQPVSVCQSNLQILQSLSPSLMASCNECTAHHASSVLHSLEASLATSSSLSSICSWSTSVVKAILSSMLSLISLLEFASWLSLSFFMVFTLLETLSVTILMMLSYQYWNLSKPSRLAFSRKLLSCFTLLSLTTRLLVNIFPSPVQYQTLITK